MVWLGAGVFEDETDGHVDNLACFAAPGKVLLTWTDDEDDPQHAISRDARERLEAATDARGRALEVVLLPSPGPLQTSAEEAEGVDAGEGTQPRRAGDRLAASYVNFYLGNSRIVMPLLDPRHDEEAASILRRTFPDREVVGVPAREILLGGGNIHCITQQVPAVPAPLGDAGEAEGVVAGGVGEPAAQLEAGARVDGFEPLAAELGRDLGPHLLAGGEGDVEVEAVEPDLLVGRASAGGCPSARPRRRSGRRARRRRGRSRRRAGSLRTARTFLLNSAVTPALSS